ncbi:hypothetical protein [Streptomyces fradiae]|uniref:hypothetical protein n=1 Tax=Streptomyces fradiae TaxID=1906 RepID=UPI003988906F
MKLRFRAAPGSALRGSLTYARSEHSFLYEADDPGDLACRAGSSGVTSLVVDTLQLEVGVETGQALYIWGYHPAGQWESTSLSLPEAAPGELLVTADEGLEEAVSVPLPGGDWRTRFDPDQGIVHVARTSQADDVVRHVRIADGVIVGLAGDSVRDFWLRPVFEV